MSEYLIEIQQASVMRGKYLALQDFNLSVRRGESLAILGPNGAGKSTLLKLISRELYPLVKPHTRIAMLGQEHFNMQEYHRLLGLVSQDLHSSYEAATPGLEVVLSGFFGSNSLWGHHRVEQGQREAAHAILHELGIAHLEDEHFGNLSTGQQRRLLLARALVHEPEALILDEPTSGMDVAACFQYLTSLSTLVHNGRAIVLVTHHLHEIPPEIQRIVLIKEGKNMFDGLKEDALTSANLSNLYGTPLRTLMHNGFYHAYPEIL